MRDVSGDDFATRGRITGSSEPPGDRPVGGDGSQSFFGIAFLATRLRR